MTSTNNELHGYYENVEFNVTDQSTNYDVAANQATFMSNFGPNNVVNQLPTSVQIRTNQTISVKLNSTANHAITITSTDSPFLIEGVKITNIFISNSSGSTAAVKLFVTSLKY